MDDGAARPIETLADVQSIVSSKRASPSELVECAQLARSLGHYDLRLRASERAIEEASGNPKIHRLSIEKAAKHVVASLKGAVSKQGELREYLESARSWITRNFGPGALEKTKNIEKLESLVSESLLLVSDPDPWCQNQLCSKLRQLERSDLGILVAERVRKGHPGNAVNLTTLGSAYTDMGQYEKAEECLRSAHRLRPKNTHTLVGLSRTLSQRSNHYEAHDFAKIAFSIMQNKYTAHRLVASALAVQDEFSLSEAMAAVQSSLGSDDSQTSSEILFAAAEELFEAKQYDAALQAIEELRKVNYKCTGAKSKRWRKLMDFWKASNQMTLEQN